MDTGKKDAQIVLLAHAVARAASAVVVVVGGLVLIGWAFNDVALESVLLGLTTMKVNTALAFILAGVALWFLRTEKADQRRRLLAHGCAGAVAFLGILTLSEYVFGWDLGIDNVVFQNLPASGQRLFPHRMAPGTALCVLLAGAALLFLDVETRRGYRPAQAFSLLSGLIAYVALAGYLYNVQDLYRVGPSAPMAMHTALTFAILGIGLLCARPDKGLMAVLTSEGVGGNVARRLLLPLVVLPGILGWLRLAGQRAGLYGTEFGLALLVTSSSASFVVLVWINAKSLDQTDAERKRIEQALQEMEMRFRRLFEANIIGLFVANINNGTIMEANEAFLRLTGFTSEDLQAGRFQWASLTPPEYRTLDDEAAAELRKARVCTPYEKAYVRKDGSLAPVIVGGALLEAPSEVGIFFTLDLTERKQAEEILQAKDRELKATTQQLWQTAKLATMGELAANIAHELNNPLATVSLRVESLLAQLSDDAPKQRMLQVIEQEVERMGALVANLLQFSRRGAPQISTLDVRGEIAQTLELIQYQLRQRRIIVVQEFAPTTPMIQADRQQLRQLFLNVFANASDAMLRGGTLTVRTSATDFEVAIDIADTGGGIAPADLPHVIEPFFTTKAEGKGTGLGLAICRRIVQEHQGTFTIVSEGLGCGATVRVTFPRQSKVNVLAIEP